MSLSKINKNLTVDNLLGNENMFYDRKFAKIDLKDLDNDIENRSNVNQMSSNEFVQDVWSDLSFPEQKAIEYIINNNGASREKIEKVIGRSRTTAVNLLNRLVDKNLIIWTGTTKSDNYGKYIIKNNL